MVNPIAATKPNPNSFLVVIPLGVGTHFSFITMAESTDTPITLPSNNPKATPKVTALNPPSNEIGMAALHKAKTGMTKKDTRLCILCSKRCEGGMASFATARISSTITICSLVRFGFLSSGSIAKNRSFKSANFWAKNLSFTRAFAGIAKAANTAAIVACTPESRKANHTPPIPIIAKKTVLLNPNRFNKSNKINKAIPINKKVRFKSEV